MAERWFRCKSCQASYQLKHSSWIGRTLRCPKCKAEINITPDSIVALPAPQPDFSTSVPQGSVPQGIDAKAPGTRDPSKPRAAPGGDRSAPDNSPAARIDPASLLRRPWFFPAAAGGILLTLLATCCLSSAIAWVFSADSKRVPADLTWVPPDSCVVFRAHPSGLVDTPAWNVIRAGMSQEKQNALENMQRYSGITLEQIESVTIGFEERRGGMIAAGKPPTSEFRWNFHFAAVVRTHETVEQSAILKWAGANQPTDFLSYRVYECPEDYLLCFADNRTVIFGTRKWVQNALADPQDTNEILQDLDIVNTTAEIQLAYTHDALTRFHDRQRPGIDTTKNKEKLLSHAVGYFADSSQFRVETIRLRKRKGQREPLGPFEEPYTHARIKQIRHSEFDPAYIKATAPCIELGMVLISLHNHGDLRYTCELDLETGNVPLQQRAITRMGTSGEAWAADALAASLRNPDHRELAAQQLVKFDQTKILVETSLLPLLGSAAGTEGDPDMQRVVLKILENKGSRDCLAALEQFLSQTELTDETQATIDAIQRRLGRRQNRINY